MGDENAFVVGTSGRDNRPLGSKPYAGGTDNPDTPEDERDPNHIWESVTLVSHWALKDVGETNETK